MKRLEVFILIFFISFSIPLAYFVVRTHQSLIQEEVAELRYFGDTLFYEMEKELLDKADFIIDNNGPLVETEEQVTEIWQKLNKEL